MRITWITFVNKLTILVMLLFTQFLFSQRIVYHFFETQDLQERDTRVENILYLSLGLALQNYGLSSSRRADDATYVLVSRYLVEEDSLSIIFSWSLASEFDPLKTPEITLDKRILINDVFEQTIGSATDTLLSKILIEPIASTEPTRVELVDQPTTENLIPEDQEDISETADIVLEHVEITPEITTEITTEETTEETITTQIEVDFEVTHDAIIDEHEVPHISEAQTLPLYTSLIVGNYFFLFQGADYFRTIPAMQFSLGTRWTFPSAVIGLGVQLGTGIVKNQTDIIGGPLAVSTMGPELFFLWRPWNYGNLLARISTGIAILSLETNNTALHKTNFYVEAAIGYIFTLSTFIDTGVIVHFRSVFDQDFPLVTVGPAFFLQVNWNHEK